MFTDSIIVETKLKKIAIRREHSDHITALSKNPILTLTVNSATNSTADCRKCAQAGYVSSGVHPLTLSNKQYKANVLCTPDSPDFRVLGKKLGDQCKIRSLHCNQSVSALEARRLLDLPIGLYFWMPRQI